MQFLMIRGGIEAAYHAYNQEFYEVAVPAQFRWYSEWEAFSARAFRLALLFWSDNQCHGAQRVVPVLRLRYRKV